MPLLSSEPSGKWTNRNTVKVEIICFVIDIR